MVQSCQMADGGYVLGMTTYSLCKLESFLGYSFRDRSLLLEALIHPSFPPENADSPPHYQRLEFLGDAVLQLVVTRFLFDTHPARQEGDLSKLRAAVCKERALARMAKTIGLGAHLRLGKGEERSGGRERASILADAFEAVLGAVYLDGGLEPVEAFLKQHLAGMFPAAEEILQHENAKGNLQELTQRLYGCRPAYHTVAVEGPDHAPRFQVEVRLNDTLVATGEGSTRKAAESRAAGNAMEMLRETPPVS